jgi:DNA-directed RNA polymerase specialized sigma24 family protein
MENKKYIVLGENLILELTFEQLLEYHRKTIFFWCYKFIRDNPYYGLEIDDLYQEFSIVLYKAFKTYSIEKYNTMCFNMLLRTGVKWKCKEIRQKYNYKKNKYINNAPEDLNNFFHLKNIDSIENMYNYNIILDYVKKLEGIDGKILKYKFLGASYSELSNLSGKSIRAVGSVITRKKASVKKLLI